VSSPLGEQLVASALKRSARPSAGVRVAAARTLFDFCGCVLGAEPVSSDWAVDLPGRLAVSAHLRDLDDLHHGSLTHPGGVVWSAVTACALERCATWGEAVEAAALGYELVVGVGNSLTAEHRRVWHATAVAGVIGSAAAAAELLGGDQSAIVDAVGHASSVASGSAQAQVERTGTRLVHRAYAASTGVTCARAACQGLNGIAHGLDGGRGAFSITPVIQDDPDGNDAASALEQTGFRLYGATGFSHAAIDAAVQLGPLEPRRIERVVVSVSPPGAVDLASNPKPASDFDAWWSIEHAVAVCLATGGTDALHVGLTHDVEVMRLCAAVELRALDMGWRTTIEVSTVDGRTLRASVNTPHGHPASPATDDDLCGKWTRMTGGDGGSYLVQLLEARPETALASLLHADVVARVGSRRPLGAASD
jgi:2-methylcitrate dehydratase PrpD